MRLAALCSGLLLLVCCVAQKCLWYLLALAILVVYACSVALIKDTGSNSTDFQNVVGWVTAGTIVCLDLCVWLCVYGGKIETPLEAVVSCMLTRTGRRRTWWKRHRAHRKETQL